MIPPLPYTLHTRYASIATAWTIILIPPIFINLGLFYGLWYGKPQLDRVLVLTIPTAVLGIFTFIAIIERIYKLTQASPQFRPLKSPRYRLDVFQWGYFAALILISVLISSALARGEADADGHDFQIRLISLPTALLMSFLATLTAISLVLNALEVKLPFQFGSMDVGEVVRPAVFYIVEDVVAVDGNGGIEYREALGARYESSEKFREMVWVLSVVWMVAFYFLAAGFTVVVFKLPAMATYAVGWAGPFPLAGLLAVWTIFYVKTKLKAEGKADEGESNGNDGSDPITRADERTPLLQNGEA